MANSLDKSSFVSTLFLSFTGWVAVHTVVYDPVTVQVQVVEDHTRPQLLDDVPVLSDHVREVTWDAHRSNYYSSVFKPVLGVVVHDRDSFSVFPYGETYNRKLKLFRI